METAGIVLFLAVELVSLLYLSADHGAQSLGMNRPGPLVERVYIQAAVSGWALALFLILAF
jgi:hypothetical protein